jgi:uncharacterized protein (TIGR00369 family)
MSGGVTDEPTLEPPHIPLHDLLGIELLPEAEGSDVIEARIPLRAEAMGFTGNLHGGAIATLVDFTGAVAAVRATDFDIYTGSMITVDMHLRYVGRPRSGTHVTCRAQCVRAGSQLIVVECKVVDDGDHLIATGDLSLMRVGLRTPLDQLST